MTHVTHMHIPHSNVVVTLVLRRSNATRDSLRTSLLQTNTRLVTHESVTDDSLQLRTARELYVRT